MCRAALLFAPPGASLPCSRTWAIWRKPPPVLRQAGTCSRGRRQPSAGRTSRSDRSPNRCTAASGFRTCTGRPDADERLHLRQRRLARCVVARPAAEMLRLRILEIVNRPLGRRGQQCRLTAGASQVQRGQPHPQPLHASPRHVRQTVHCSLLPGLIIGAPLGRTRLGMHSYTRHMPDESIMYAGFMPRVPAEGLREQLTGGILTHGTASLTRDARSTYPVARGRRPA